MKHWLNRKFSFLVTAVLLSIYSLAQDTKKVDVNIDVNKGDSNWYQQPWVWIVGGAAFILLIVAIARGGGSKKE